MVSTLEKWHSKSHFKSALEKYTLARKVHSVEVYDSRIVHFSSDLRRTPPVVSHSKSASKSALEEWPLLAARLNTRHAPGTVPEHGSTSSKARSTLSCDDSTTFASLHFPVEAFPAAGATTQ